MPWAIFFKYPAVDAVKFCTRECFMHMTGGAGLDGAANPLPHKPQTNTATACADFISMMATLQTENDKTVNK